MNAITCRSCTPKPTWATRRAPGLAGKEWANMVRLKDDGVPITGFTWYSLTDQVDWDTILREG